MNVVIDIEKLIKYKINANEYIALYLKFINLEIKELNLSNIYDSLITKGFINSSGGLNVPPGLFKDITSESINSWIKEWLSLWPTMLLPNGYRVSGNSLECKKRMVRFQKIFPQYDKDIIIQATTNYLTRQEHYNWQYTKKNSKFIFDSETSTLEQECEAILNGENNVTSTNTIDF